MCINFFLLFRSHRDHGKFKDEDLTLIKTVYSHIISTLARNSKLRQRVAATAIVYFKRFYARNAVVDHDPRLIAPVALVRLPQYVSEQNAHFRDRNN